MTANSVPMPKKRHHHRKSSKKVDGESENAGSRSGSKNDQEPIFLWPPRSLERRRFFQDLYSSFYQQVLTGCGEITCTNPTCATFRNRISRGPFRPYTALSARALASHLAAQDHPSRRLCPSLKSRLNRGADASGHSRLLRDPLRDSDNDRKASKNVPSFGGNRTGVHGSSPNRLSHGHMKHPIDNDRDVLEESSKNKSKTIPIHLGQLELPTEQNDSCQKDEKYPPPPPPPSSSAAETKPRSSKAKDHKSIAQNLFDSVPLALLQFARLPQIWGMSDDEYLPKEGKPCEGQQLPLDSQGSHAQGVQKGATVVKASHVRRLLKPLESSQHPPKADVSFESLPTANAHRDGGVSRSPDASIIKRGLLIDQVHFKMLRSHCEFLECADSQSSSKIFALPRQLIQSTCLPLRPHSLLQIGAPPHPAGPCPCELQLIETKHEQGDSKSPDQFLTYLGRIEGPNPCVGPKKHQYGELKRIGPSLRIKVTCDLLWSSDHLLKVFLSRSDVRDGLVVFGSLEFADLMERFDHKHAGTPFPRRIFTDLWQALRCFDTSIESLRKSLDLKSRPASLQGYYGVPQVVHISRIVLAALCAYSPIPSVDVWIAARRLRRRGYVTFPPHLDGGYTNSAVSDKAVVELMEMLDDDIALSLLKRLTRAIGGYTLLAAFLVGLEPGSQDDSEDDPMIISILTLIVRSIWEPNVILVTREETSQPLSLNGSSPWRLNPAPNIKPPDKGRLSHRAPEVIVEWLYGILLRDWNGEASFPRMSAVAGALRLLEAFYKHYGRDWLVEETFEAPFISDRLDLLKTPVDWLNEELDATRTHILDYPFVFKPSILVSFFRSINVARMWKASQEGMANAQLAHRLIFTSEHTNMVRNSSLWGKLFEHYLVLEIKRETALTDAMNQLWRRRRCELIRPLKVRIGHGLGEDGIDHGGVQQEFFRIAIAEALDPKYGAFTTDPETHMSWFQPDSLEPLYKFELLGILTSLAIYNGVTLPFTFPIALYMKILNRQPNSTSMIADGWPELARGLRALAEWDEKDGTVEEVFCRTYDFSVDVFGSTKTTGLHPQRPVSPRKSPPDSPRQTPRSASPEGAHMVTGENRYGYIRDYIHHLTTTSIEPQYEAFVKGLKTVIHPRSLKLFHPSALQALVEGVPDINTHELEQVAKYEGGYAASDAIIQDFWYTLHAWSESLTPEFTKVDDSNSRRYLVPDAEGPDKVRRLLEFVTASDRLPVGGAGQVVFVVQKNGDGDDRLPTSHTCFGRLLLPVYSGHQVMLGMLIKAVENAQGFGQP